MDQKEKSKFKLISRMNMEFQLESSDGALFAETKQTYTAKIQGILFVHLNANRNMST